jgi:hypothetical protein
MIDINKEAEEWFNIRTNKIPVPTSLWHNSKNLQIDCFIAGHDSKATQAKILQAQIDENKSILKMAELHMDERACMVLNQRIFELTKQLEQ